MPDVAVHISFGREVLSSLAEEVQEMWVNFAKNGDPSTAEHPWEPYDKQKRNTMFLGDEVHLAEDPMPEQRELIRPLLNYWINGYYGVYDYAVKYMRKEITIFLVQLLILQGIVFAGYLGYRRFRMKRWCVYILHRVLPASR